MLLEYDTISMIFDMIIFSVNLLSTFMDLIFIQLDIKPLDESFYTMVHL